LITAQKAEAIDRTDLSIALEHLCLDFSYSPSALPTCRDTGLTIALNNLNSIDLNSLTDDSDGDLLASGFSVLSNPTNGSLSIDALGTASYTPQFNYSGPDSYQYIATDTGGGTCTGTISIIIGCPIGTANEIYGTVFTDENQDGIINNSDTAFSSGVTVNLYEDNNPNDGLADGAAINSTSSDATGSYSFTIINDYLDTLQTSYFLTSASDDARERTNGTTENDVAQHSITKDRNDTWNGFRFNNITIPANAIITQAYIVFTSNGNYSTNTASTRFYGQDGTANASTFNDCNRCNDITSRSLTSNFTDWTNVSAWATDNTYNSPDLSSIVQEIIDDQAGLSSGSIAIITQSLPDGEERSTYSYDTDPTRAPELVIEYAYPEPGLEFNYIVELDQASIPLASPTITTASDYAVSFNAPAQSSCDNNFGIYTLVQSVPECRDTSYSVATNYNSSVDLTSLTNDDDGDLSPSGLSITSLPSNGSVNIDGAGIASYTPQFNFSGSVSYVYMATDDMGAYCTATVSITLGCPSGPDNEIYGTVFTDYNSDGIINNNDNSFSGGAIINLYEDNSPNDGVADGPAVQTIVADGNGNYSFSVFHDYLDTLQSNSFLSSITDDAREKRNGATETDRAEHSITKDRDDAWNGFRFNNISIPSNATITQAYISFTSNGNYSNTLASTRIYAQDETASPATFTDCGGCNDITSRSLTSNFTDWSNVSAWTQDNVYNSPDISAVIQEIIDDQAGLSAGSVVIITQSLDDGEERNTYSYDTDPSRAPELFIEYTVPVPYNYIVEIDPSSIPVDTPTITTATQFLITFNALYQTTCNNNFGIIPQFCLNIYTNGFIRYNRIGSN